MTEVSNLLRGLAKAAENDLQFVIAGLVPMLSSLSISFTHRPDDIILTRPLPSSVFASKSTSRLDAGFWRNEASALHAILQYIAHKKFP